MTLSRRVLPASRGWAQQEPIRIGVLNDQSGLYRDFGGPTSVLAARMAVEDFGGNVFGRPIEVIDGPQLILRRHYRRFAKVTGGKPLATEAKFEIDVSGSPLRRADRVRHGTPRPLGRFSGVGSGLRHSPVFMTLVLQGPGYQSEHFFVAH